MRVAYSGAAHFEQNSPVDFAPGSYAGSSMRPSGIDSSDIACTGGPPEGTPSGDGGRDGDGPPGGWDWPLPPPGMGAPKDEMPSEGPVAVTAGRGLRGIGIEGDEVAQSILGLIYAGTSYKVIERAMYVHPTVSELLRRGYAERMFWFTRNRFVGSYRRFTSARRA